MELQADYIREWSLKKIDREFYNERAQGEGRVRQVKARLAGSPNWWHGATGSPVTNEVTQKITEKPVHVHTQVMATQPTQTMHPKEGLKEYETNCVVAETLRRTQMNDSQM